MVVVVVVVVVVPSIAMRAPLTALVQEPHVIPSTPISLAVSFILGFFFFLLGFFFFLL